MIDSYEILYLDPNEYISKEILKTAYKYKARQTHPDMGGSNEDFIKVKEAYKYVYRQMRPIWNTTNENVEYQKQIRTATEQTISTNGDEFDEEQFHRDFNNFKIKSEYDVDLVYVDNGIKMPSIKKESNFHNEFTDHHDQFKKNDKIICYEEPKAVNSMYEADITILGRSKIEDFSTSKSTDYSKAYTKYNTIYQNINIPKDNDNIISTRQFQTFEHERNINTFDLTEADQTYYAAQNKKKEIEEQQRKINQAQHDQMVASKYQSYQHRIQQPNAS